MSELRWTLLAIGVLLLVGIFFYSRASARRSKSPEALRREPILDPVVEPDVPVAPVAQRSSATATRVEEPPATQVDLPLGSRPGAAESSEAAGADEKVIVIHIAAKSGRRFAGPQLVEVLQAESLEHGDFDIFHRRTGNRSVFSVTSMVEPGTFDLDNIDQFSTPGISFFMMLPGPESPVAAFTEMLSTARRVGTVLGGEVLDENGSTLSRQAASHLREQIIEFAHRVR